MKTAPSQGIICAMAFRSVDLPAPLGPTIISHRPEGRISEARLTTSAAVANRDIPYIQHSAHPSGLEKDVDNGDRADEGRDHAEGSSSASIVRAQKIRQHQEHASGEHRGGQQLR
jgi:hypothetical protein